MNVLSLFAGIGGLDLGLEWAGFRTIAFVERDAACQHWLKQHWPAVPIHGDIHTFSGVPLRGLVGLVCGGFPCQPFSVAGKQKGTEDERHLWPEMSRIIREVRPRWVLAENVPGLRTIAADLVLEDLEGQGYTCWPLVVGADDVGAPHRRKRVWIVAYRDGERCEGLNALLQPGRSPQEPEPRHAVRWPSRPGEPQHPWEAPRLAHTERGRRNRREGAEDRDEFDGSDAGRLQGDGESSGGHSPEGRGVSGSRSEVSSEPSRSPGQPRQESDPREPESPLGGAASGFSGGLAGLSSSHRREALKALGNAVSPPCAYYIGRAIMNAEQERTE